jgi:hypothetical protein
LQQWEEVEADPLKGQEEVEDLPDHQPEEAVEEEGHQSHHRLLKREQYLKDLLTRKYSALSPQYSRGIETKPTTSSKHSKTTCDLTTPFPNSAQLKLEWALHSLVFKDP